jgi:ubiquinol-cytochrome c reductase cytochrome c subunit
MSVLSVVAIFVLVPLAVTLASAEQNMQSSPPDGKAIFSRHCAMCHGEHGEGISAHISIAGPSLQAEHDPGLAIATVEAGRSHMPSFAYVLSVPEMRAVADFVTQQLAVIPLAGGNLSEGGTLFRTHCSACHRTAARGGALAFTGVNAPALSGLSPALIAGAIRWGPGPMPSFPAAVLNDQQLDSIVEYVKYVQHPPSPGGNPLRYYGPVVEGFVAGIGLLALVVFTGWIERGGKG